MRFAALAGLRRRVHQLVQVLQARLGFRRLLLLQHVAVPGAFQDEPQQVRQRRRAGHQGKFLNQVAERHQRGLRPGGEMLIVDDALDGVPQVQPVLAAIALDLLHRGAADAARRRVDDAQQAHRIGVGGRQLQVRHRVLDFRALVKTEAADDVVLAPVAPQRLFDPPRLGSACGRGSPRDRRDSPPDASRWCRR